MCICIYITMCVFVCVCVCVCVCVYTGTKVLYMVAFYSKSTRTLTRQNIWLQERVDLLDELALASRLNFPLKRLVLLSTPAMIQYVANELRKLTLDKWRQKNYNRNENKSKYSSDIRGKSTRQADPGKMEAKNS
jgi:hypothetical protein